jgi:hypothetical protein
VTSSTSPGPAPQAEAKADDDEWEDLPQCKCGTNRRSKYSVANRDYSFMGLLYLLWGGTAIPTKVAFRCVKCGAIIESTTSRRICEEHVI